MEDLIRYVHINTYVLKLLSSHLNPKPIYLCVKMDFILWAKNTKLYWILEYWPFASLQSFRSIQLFDKILHTHTHTFGVFVVVVDDDGWVMVAMVVAGGDGLDDVYC